VWFVAYYSPVREVRSFHQARNKLLKEANRAVQKKIRKKSLSRSGKGAHVDRSRTKNKRGEVVRGAVKRRAKNALGCLVHSPAPGDGVGGDSRRTRNTLILQGG